MSSLPSIVQGIDGLPTMLHVPAELLRFRGLRRDPLLAYAVLWNLNGCRPGKITVDYLRLRITMAASEQGVRRWLASLDNAGLIDILERQPRQATIRVRDWREPRQIDADAASKECKQPEQLLLPIVEPVAEDREPGVVSISIWATAQRSARRPIDDRPAAG